MKGKYMREQILAILNEVGDESFENSTNFIEDGLIDSYQMVEIVDGIEEEFDIEISGRDIIPDNFVSLEAIEAMISKYLED